MGVGGGVDFSQGKNEKKNQWKKEGKKKIAIMHIAQYIVYLWKYSVTLIFEVYFSVHFCDIKLNYW